MQRVRKCPKSGKWVVTVKGGAAVEAHRTYGAGQAAAGATTRMMARVARGCRPELGPGDGDGRPCGDGRLVVVVVVVVGHGRLAVPEDPEAPEETFLFDGIAICSGTNNWACLPQFEGRSASQPATPPQRRRCLLVVLGSAADVVLSCIG